MLRSLLASERRGVVKTFRYVPQPIGDSAVTDDQALFVACLPHAFRDIDQAIAVHSFMQRVAAVTPQFARDAIQIAMTHGFVETDGLDNVRLSPALQTELDELTKSEGYAEVAQGELADLLVQRSRGSSGT